MIMLAADYDGTLKQGTITRLDLDAITKFRSLGNIFGVVTGRSLSMMKEEFDKFDLKFDFFIAQNGAIAFTDTFTTIYETQINPIVSARLINMLQKLGPAMYGAATRDKHTVFHMSRQFYDERIAYYDIPLIVETWHNLNGILSFFICDFSSDAISELYNKLSSEFSDLLSFHYNDGTIDVTAPGLNKSKGVQRVIEFFKPQCALTIGNEMNDLSMIVDFGGFSVANGRPEVQAAASRVFENIDQCITFILETN